jgi:D-alanyl-D-alanine carboxypeptidase/D-alanyl-D-alanine-endopeptidase (penicillin-binding protein 4)
VLQQILRQQKIHLNGQIIAGKTSPQNKVLATIKSPPLKQLLITMNKDSNNLYAKTMFLSLGAYKTSNANTYSNSQNVYQTTLKAIIKSNALVPENGAGLSRTERLSPEQMTDLLYALYHSPESNIFMQSLPSPSDSGTLQNEYPQFKQQLFAKTGSLNDVKAYSGYFISKNNHTYIISIIANGINASTSQQPQLIEFKKFFADTLGNLN